MYGLTLDNEKLLIEKARAKKDGCYRLRGVAYRVNGGKITHFASDGQIIERCQGFNVVVGTCPKSSEPAQDKLKAIFKGGEK